MLYTVRPLERIYAAPEIFERQNQNKQTDSTEGEYHDVILPNGRIITRREGENYIVEKINSTDMKDYLNEEYIPGRNMKGIE